MGKLLNLQAVVAEEPYGVTLLVRIWRGPRLGNWPRLLYRLVVAPCGSGGTSFLQAPLPPKRPTYSGTGPKAGAERWAFNLVSAWHRLAGISLIPFSRRPRARALSLA